MLKKLSVIAVLFCFLLPINVFAAETSILDELSKQPNNYVKEQFKKVELTLDVDNTTIIPVITFSTRELQELAKNNIVILAGTQKEKVTFYEVKDEPHFTTSAIGQFNWIELEKPISTFKYDKLECYIKNKPIVKSYPLRDWSSRTLSSGYGMRTHPITGEHTMHTGVDYPAPYGSEILATQAGTVTTAEYNSSYGYYVKITHEDNFSTLYAHASSLNVVAGQKVKAGDVIAHIGSTGSSTGNHLHFEYITNGPINPTNYLQ